MEEPNWENEWDKIISNITYAGVFIHRCPICGDRDRDYCDCAKADWIIEQKITYKIQNNLNSEENKIHENKIQENTFKDEIIQRTKTARQQKLEEEKVNRLVSIEIAKHIKDGFWWKICEETIWPDIQKYIISHADIAEKEFTYQVNYKNFSIPYHVIEPFIMKCLVPFIATKGFKAKYVNISGINSGTHVKIGW